MRPIPSTTPAADLDFHPAAALFPLLPVDGPEFGDLVRDIRKHGQRQPIVPHKGRESQVRCRSTQSQRR
jgi:hypothetical protein